MLIWIKPEFTHLVERMGVKLAQQPGVEGSYFDARFGPCEPSFFLPPIDSEHIKCVTEKSYFKQKRRIPQGLYGGEDDIALLRLEVMGTMRDDGLEYHHTFSVMAPTVAALEELYMRVRTGEAKPFSLWDEPQNEPSSPTPTPPLTQEPTNSADAS